MQSLVKLNLENNLIKDMKALSNDEAFPKLQILNLGKNKINELVSIKCGRLVSLELSHNLIEKTESFDGHPKLKMLSLRNNKINALN